MALLKMSKSLVALGSVAPAAGRAPIGLKLVPATSHVMNGHISIRYASAKNDRIKDLRINNLTKNLDLFTSNSIKVGLEHNSGKSVEPGTAKSLKLSSGAESQQPMVVMLPWLMSKNQHIAKFAEIYVKLGFEVLTCRITPWQVLWPAKDSQIIANDLLQFLEANARNRPLLIQGFSVGSLVWGKIMIMLQKDKDRYRPLLNNIVGHIWDSVVSVQEISDGLPTATFPNIIEGISRAVFPSNLIMRNAMKKYIRHHMRIFYNIATSHYIRSNQMLNSSIVRSPALILASKTDQISTLETNQNLADNWQSLGIDVSMKIWEDSQHVSHFRKYPEEYIAEVTEFLAKVGFLPQLPAKFSHFK